MFTKDSSRSPSVVLCPRCHFALNPRECYNVNVDFCMPALPPPPPPTAPINPTHVKCSHPSCRGHPPPAQHSAQSEDSSPSSSAEQSPVSTPSVHHKRRRSSTASTDYLAEFDRLAVSSESEASPRQTKATSHLSQEVTRGATPSLALSPSTESSLIPSTPGEQEPLPLGRRWVVFRGRIPGVYTNS